MTSFTKIDITKLSSSTSPLTIHDWQVSVHELARKKGWYDKCLTDNGFLHPLEIAGRLANIHGEVSEALECLRDGSMAIEFGSTGKPEGFGVELADVIIRVLDLCQAIGIDLEYIIKLKHRYNESRPYRHGGKAL